ncbi:DGKQ family protein [Megaselia abdita]
MVDSGHTFGKKTFHKPTYCHHCSDLLWGLIGQGYICEVCNFIVHERCLSNVVTPCSGIAPCIINNPVAHCWSEPTQHKKKFCTVCRKRLDESLTVHCLICEYFAHVECQDFAVPDCKENATYVPNKDLSQVVHQHHWREGNLPPTSKCGYCRKACSSYECLTGYRCEWCGTTTHGGCRVYITSECKFGNLHPIYLPPHAVSIPRTEVPMEDIIGVQVKPKGTQLQRDYSCPDIKAALIGKNAYAQNSNRHCKKCFVNMLSSSSSYTMLLKKLKFRRKQKEAHKVYVSDDLDISTEDEDHYLDLSSSTLSCLNYLEYSDSDIKERVNFVNRSKSFQETGVVMPLLRKQRGCTKCDNSSNKSKLNSNGGNGWSYKELDGNDLNVFCDNKRCRLIKKKHFFDRFFNQIRNISKGYRKINNIDSPDERARSISEEFSSGDASRVREEENSSKVENIPTASRDCKDSNASSSAGSSVVAGHQQRPETSAKYEKEKEKDKEKADKDKEKKDKDREERDEEMIKVFDGASSLKRRIYRVITVPRYFNLEQLLTASLRAFHISREPDAFYLTDLYAPNENVPLRDPNPILNLTHPEGKRPAIYLRFHDIDRGFVRVYTGKLQMQAQEPFASIAVRNESTVLNLIEDAIQQFQLEGEPIDYRCSEVLLDRGVTERILELEERPWEIMKNLGHDSIRQMELMRFYLQHKKDPHGPNIALFVGNLPSGLSERQYDQIITKFTTDEFRRANFGPIYYEYGSLIMLYEKPHLAVQAFYLLKEAVHEDKKLLVLLLPNITPKMVPPGVLPLLVFVNVKSGGCQGSELISSFRKLLNPYQVFDLDNGGPLPGLYVFREIKKYKILVCGGDGTIGWVLQCLDNVGQDSICSSPPCAIVPLGTGNDLARVLRWGPGYTGGEDPLNLLRDVIEAEEIRLDRWTVVFHPEDKPDEPALKAPTNTSGKSKKKKIQQVPISQQNRHHQLPAISTLSISGGATQSEDNSQIFVMNNYFGIGVDADLCLDFHNAREENPNKFNSRLHNKSVYLRMGLKKIVGRKSVDLSKELRLEVDGKVIDLPTVEGLIILNILSWGSGANPWGPEKDDVFSKPNHYDGMLEIVGVTGVVHLGQIQSGLRSATRIAQGGHIKIHINTDLAVQVDGEPWIQSPSDIVVLKSALKVSN